ncbi:MAG: ATPase, T2SS/T4P/T4SS family, partial [Deltaproteobacteria bacterium]|nr:ATPase, T2SS/T4P/T4SS family [Deltaproteobacteria bacterium]
MSETIPTPPATPAAQATRVSHEGLRHPLLSLLAQEFKVSVDRLIPYDTPAGTPGPGLAVLREGLVHGRLVPSEVFQQAVAKFYGLEYRMNLDDAELLQEFTERIPIRYAKKFMFYPVRLTPQVLVVAVENPELMHPVRDVARRFRRPVQTVVATHQSILSLINRAYERTNAATDEVIEGFDESQGGVGFGIEEPEDLIDARDEEPIKRLLNNILYQAARTNASDVHIDSAPGDVVVRLRVDGMLHVASTLPKAVQRPLINRIKIMSRLDISQ